MLLCNGCWFYILLHFTVASILAKALYDSQIKTWRVEPQPNRRRHQRGDNGADYDCYFQGRKCGRGWKILFRRSACLDIFGVVVLGMKSTTDKMPSHLTCEQSFGSTLRETLNTRNHTEHLTLEPSFYSDIIGTLNLTNRKESNRPCGCAHPAAGTPILALTCSEKPEVPLSTIRPLKRAAVIGHYLDKLWLLQGCEAVTPLQTGS